MNIFVKGIFREINFKAFGINFTKLNKIQVKNIHLKRFLCRLLLGCIALLVVLTALFYITSGPKNTNNFIGPRSVTIQYKNGQYSFYKNGKPFLVKGGAGYTYVKEMAACGGNTIICWDTAKIENALKEAEQYHVSVIIGLDVPGGHEIEFYNDQEKVTALYKAYSNLILRYKNHSSLLAWCLGNELSMPYSLTPSPFYKSYNGLLSMMHNNDPHHPVATSTINIPKRQIINMKWRIPALDFICINTYNSLKSLPQELNKIKMFWDGPYLVGEWAPAGGWEANVTAWDAPIENTSTKKAQQYYEFYTKYMPLKDPRFLGSLVFYWGGSRQEYTPTWYGIFNEKGFSTEIKETMYDCWKDTITSHVAPKLQQMLIDKLGAKDNIIVSPGSQHNASVLLGTMHTGDTLKYHWEILKEDWQHWGRTWNNFKKPQQEQGLLFDSTLQNTSFKAPLKEGPYRVLLTVYNSKGYCATANVPIYVIE